MRNARLSLGIFAAAAAFAASPLAHADIFTLTATDDAYVDSANATTNFGAATTLQYAQASGPVKTRVTYVKFDLTGIDRTTITAATLKFAYAVDADARTNPNAATTFQSFQMPQVFGLNNGASEAWTESAITYNNAPGIVSSGADVGAGDDKTTAVLGQIFTKSTVANTTLPIGSTVAGVLDLTSNSNAGINWFAADTNNSVTFIITMGNLNVGRQFYSKEDTNGYMVPTLELTAEPLVPEPASLGVLGVGALALLARRSRR